MGTYILCCDSCGEDNNHTPIIEKPSRFGFKGKVRPLMQVNNDGRKTGNICLKCLDEEIESLKTCVIDGFINKMNM